MRPIVRKARVRIIRNLIREIKILKVKRGDEKKLIKFKRRADRFLDEVEAAKKVKDDEVSNFGLVNTRSLYSILDDPTSDARTRVIAKFADFPEMQQRIAQFKEKFPDYEKFLGPGKKKLARLEYEKRAEFIEEKRQKQIKEKEQKKKLKEDKANSSEDNSDNEMEIENEGIDKVIEEEEDEEEEEEEEQSEDEQDDNSEEMEEDCESESLKPNSKSKNTQKLKLKSESEHRSKGKAGKRKPVESDSESDVKLPKQVQKRLKKEKSASKSKAEKRKPVEPESEIEEEEPDAKNSNKNVSKPSKNSKIMLDKIAPIIAEPPRKRKLDTKEIKIVTKEATVKRFSELLQDEEADEQEEEIEHEISEMKKPESKTQKEGVNKEVDSFFVTADGSQEYLRVVVPKKIENQNLPNKNPDYTNPQEERDFIRNKSERNNSSFTSMNKFEGRSNKFRGDNTWDKNNSDSKSEPRFEPRMEKRSHERNNPRDRNNFKFGPRMEKGRGIEARSVDKFSNKSQKKAVASDEHLHPSWAAKKKQQDALKLGFQGKKIVFDD